MRRHGIGIKESTSHLISNYQRTWPHKLCPDQMIAHHFPEALGHREAEVPRRDLVAVDDTAFEDLAVGEELLLVVPEGDDGGEGGDGGGGGDGGEGGEGGEGGDGGHSR